MSIPETVKLSLGPDPLAELARLIGQADSSAGSFLNPNLHAHVERTFQQEGRWREWDPRSTSRDPLGGFVPEPELDAFFDHKLILEPRRERIESPAGDTPHTHHKWWMKISGSGSRAIVTAHAANAPVPVEEAIGLCSDAVLENIFTCDPPAHVREICPAEICVPSPLPMMNFRAYHQLLSRYKGNTWCGGIMGEFFPKRGNAIYRWQQAPYDTGFKYWGVYCYDRKLPAFPKPTEHLLRALRL